jgi:RNA polymerase sigma-70 factor (ECF subfamily)
VVKFIVDVFKGVRSMLDLDLLAQLKNNNKQAFRIFFDRYRPNVYRTAYLILKDQHYADDVVQETFLQVFLKINKLTNPMAFEKWLYKITVNLCFEAIRKKGKADILTIDDDIDILINTEDIKFLKPDEIAIQREIQENIMKSIDSLSVKHKTVVILFYFNDFNLKEISEIIDCTEGTVKSRLFYAKKLLKDALIEQYNEKDYEGAGGVVYEF